MSINLTSTTELTLTYKSWVTLAIFILQVLSIHRPLKLKLPFANLHLNFNYVTTPVLGAIILLATLSLQPNDLVIGILGESGDIEPTSILVLVFSLAYLCVKLDVTGLFKFIALYVVKRSTSPIFLFINLYLLSLFISIFFSNDVVILTLTPLIVYFSSTSEVESWPFLISEFISANTGSMALYVGNPTNVVISMAYQITFIKYSSAMTLPFIASSVISLTALLYRFNGKLNYNLKLVNVDPRSGLKHVKQAIIGSVLLIGALIALVITSLYHVPVWLATLPFALLQLVLDILFDLFFRGKHSQHTEKDFVEESHFDESIMGPDQIANEGAPSPLQTPNDNLEINFLSRSKPVSEKITSSIIDKFPVTSDVLIRLPWGLIPFLLGMFVTVQALKVNGWISNLAHLFVITLPSNPAVWCFVVGIVTLVFCAIFNNLPASILLAKAITIIDFGDDKATRVAAVLALIVSANLGANMVSSGSLAGIMWRGLLRGKGVKFNERKMLSTTSLVTPITLIVALASILLQVYCFPKEFIDNLLTS